MRNEGASRDSACQSRQKKKDKTPVEEKLVFEKDFSHFILLLLSCSILGGVAVLALIKELRFEIPISRRLAMIASRIRSLKNKCDQQLHSAIKCVHSSGYFFLCVLCGRDSGEGIDNEPSPSIGSLLLFIEQ